MKSRPTLLLLLMMFLALPLAAEKHKVRVHFGIDPRHPYYEDYRDAARMSRLQNLALNALFEPPDDKSPVGRLQRTVGFVDFVRGNANNELLIEIADKKVILGDAPRDVFLRVKLRFDDDGVVTETEPTFWEFRPATRFSDLMTDVDKFGAEIKLALINHVDAPNKSRINELVSRHLVELKIARGREAALCQTHKGAFVLRLRPEDLGFDFGTVFRVKTVNFESDGTQLVGRYDARYDGTSGTTDLPREYRKKPLLRLEKAAREELASVTRVETTSLHIREYKPGRRQNAASVSTAF